MKEVQVGFSSKVQARLHFAINCRFTEAELMLISEWDATATYAPFQSEKELIVDSSYPANYVLELSCIDTGVNTSDIVYSVFMQPILKRKYHFCGMRCLSGWASNDL
jgi:hypothetical protein